MKYLIMLSILFLSACGTTPEVALKSQSTDVIQLIEKAERRYPEGVRGTFQLPIKASGTQRGMVYLNTDLDYRDPKNITVALFPATIDAFAETYGASPDSYFIDKTIEVTGKVERIKIYTYKNGKRTKKYYFQTHIKVNSIEQIKVLS